MSITDISSRLLDTTVTLQRRTNTTDSLGDFTEVWNNLETGIRATIQPMTVREANDLLQGREYMAIYKAYIPENITSTPRNGDRVIDDSDSIVYEIISVQRNRASRRGISSGHHYKLLLEIPRAPKS
jgi:hypothetical protein